MPTLERWYKELTWRARPLRCPVNPDAENYREAFELGISPAEFLADEISYGMSDTLYDS